MFNLYEGITDDTDDSREQLQYVDIDVSVFFPEFRCISEILSNLKLKSCIC